jgi:hypothetical protein
LPLDEGKAFYHQPLQNPEVKQHDEILCQEDHKSDLPEEVMGCVDEECGDPHL